jgi:bifunctional NMN adenylyltransferase/nudix hydrolase
MTDHSSEIAVVIGRFQPFHNGHAMLLARALEVAPRVIVVLGSSFHARSPKNPFTWQERAAMIAATLTEQDRARVTCVPVRDYYDDKRWASAVQRAVKDNARDARSIALVGYFKDASSYYLNHFPQWNLVTCDNAPDIDATRVRRILFEAEDIDVSLRVVAGLIPTAVRQYLKAWALLPGYAPLVEEYRKVEGYKAAWKAAPYPPIFVTVDAVVKTAGHVLLIRRGDFPGKGLWALPGGFLDQHERLLAGALRELREETRLALLPSTLAESLVDVAVFDHPDRSLRGRTITHAHFFDLKMDKLPDVEGSDDAAHAQWVALDEIAAMEESFHDDHFHILDHFLRLTEDRQ